MTKIPEELKNRPFHPIVKSRVPSLLREGREYTACCPFHTENTPSFRIYQGGDGVWLWKCFGCGANGNVFQFVERFDKIPFSMAVDKVKKEFNWEESKDTVNKVFQEVLEDKKPFLTYPLSKFQKCEDALGNSHVGEKWLSDRGIGMDVARVMHLGFVQSLRYMSPNHPWTDDGWVVFPTLRGETITAIKYRSVRGKKTEDGRTSGILRAQNTSTTLYNLDSVTSADDVYVVEGEPDAVIMMQAGFTAVGLPSADYSMTPAERDVVMHANRIFLAGDMDTPGQNAMKKLWSEFKDRTYLIQWPSGCKDANDTFLKTGERDIGKFHSLVESKVSEALEKPMMFVHDLRESMRSMDKTNPFDDPTRLRFPWPQMDKWTPVVPGDVMTLFATESKTGKTSWLMNLLLFNAVHYNKTIVNYSAELTAAAYARRCVAHLTHSDRETLKQENYNDAIKTVKSARFYNGYQPGADYKSVIELFGIAKQRLGADIFVVDHLHFLTRGTKDENQAVAEAMRLCKDFAVENGVIVIVVGQPRKRPSAQKNWEATAQDAKSSEAFGSDASQVFILHRERTNSPKENEPIFSPVTKVKLDYSRESSDKVTNLFFEGHTCSFVEMTTQQSPQETSTES